MKVSCGFGLLLLVCCVVAQDKEDESCKCVLYYLCSKDGTIITDGMGLIDERFGGKCSCECQKGYTCCRLTGTGSRFNDTVTSAPVSTSPSSHPRCGVANPDGVGYKIGSASEAVAFGEFPWMIRVLLGSGSYRCGGSLIHPSVVLTAAHCVVKKDNYSARAGEWDTSNTREIFKHQDQKVASLKIHEDFIPGIYYNDVALLFLEAPFTLGQHINLACLPKEDTVFDDETCIAPGWGKDKFGGEGNYPAILRKVSLPMVKRSQCEKNLRKTRLGDYFRLHDSFVCAGGIKGKDTCIGDGGGPLLCPISGEDDRYQQIGITAWGVDCNEDNVPGVYSNIPHLRQWIDKQMKEKGFGTESYQF